MSFFDLDIPQEYGLKDRASRTPIDTGDLDPGFLSDAIPAGAKGLVSGAIGKPALLLGDAATPVLTPIARSVDAAFGSNTTQWLEGEQRKNLSLVKELLPDPRTVGTAGQILFGFGDVLPAAVAGTVAGGPAGGAAAVGGLQGYAGFRVGQSEGLDPVTALEKGAVEGATSAAGVVMPMSVGTRLGINLAFGAASNIGLGMASRGATAAILDANGYHDMADQYKVLDKQAMIIDAALGTAFGGIGTLHARARGKAALSPTEIDAALAANNAQHIELDTAPGVPTNPAARDAHVDSVIKATEDLMLDRPVDVAPIVHDADFIDNPKATEVRQQIADEVRQSLLDPERAMQEEFAARARELGVSEDAIAQLSPKAPRDNVTGFFDARQGTVKTDTIARAQEHVARTGDSAFYVSADISNLGGLNAAMSNVADRANTHYRALAEIMADEFRKVGGDVVPLRTGGDEISAVVTGKTDHAAIERAIADIQDRIARYGAEKGLSDIPHPKRVGEKGVGLHIGFDEITPDRSIGAITETADLGVNRSKNNVTREQGRTTRPDRTDARATRGADSGAGAETPEGGPRVEGETGGATRPPESSGAGQEVNDAATERARQVLAENPDLKITLDDGSVVPAAEALQQANVELAEAQQKAKLFDIAAACFLGG